MIISFNKEDLEPVEIMFGSKIVYIQRHVFESFMPQLLLNGMTDVRVISLDIDGLSPNDENEVIITIINIISYVLRVATDVDFSKLDMTDKFIVLKFVDMYMFPTTDDHTIRLEEMTNKLIGGMYPEEFSVGECAQMILAGNMYKIDPKKCGKNYEYMTEAVRWLIKYSHLEFIYNCFTYSGVSLKFIGTTDSTGKLIICAPVNISSEYKATFDRLFEPIIAIGNKLKLIPESYYNIISITEVQHLCERYNIICEHHVTDHFYNLIQKGDYQHDECDSEDDQKN